MNLNSLLLGSQSESTIMMSDVFCMSDVWQYIPRRCTRSSPYLDIIEMFIARHTYSYLFPHECTVCPTPIEFLRDQTKITYQNLDEVIINQRTIES